MPSRTFQLAIATHLVPAYDQVGETQKAAHLAEEILPAAAQVFGESGSAYAQALFIAGTMNTRAARHDSAKRLFEQSVQILEHAPEHAHPLLPPALGSLAITYIAMGQWEEAEQLLSRALAMKWSFEGVDGSQLAPGTELFDVMVDNQLRDSPDLLRGLLELAAASAYQMRGELKLAEKYSRQACEKIRPTKHPLLGHALLSYGRVLAQRGDARRAQSVLEEALKTLADAYPGNDLALLPARLTLAITRVTTNPREAERQLSAIADTAQKRLGPDSEIAIDSHFQLGELYWNAGEHLKALDKLASAAGGILIQSQRRRLSAATSSLTLPNPSSTLMLTEFQAAVLSGKKVPPEERWTNWADDMFAVIQLSQQSVTGEALSMMAARVAAADPQIEALVRQREQAAVDRARIEHQVSQLLAKPPSSRNQSLDDVIARLKKQSVAVEEWDRKLTDRFPRYESMMRPAPIPLSSVSAALQPGEALLALHFPKDATFGIGWVIRKHSAGVRPLPVGYEKLTDQVRSLRAGLGAQNGGTLPAFDLALAHEIYKEVIGPLVDMLHDTRHLLVVSDYPLSSLPLSVLVTEEPQRQGHSGQSTDQGLLYQEAKWLGQEIAISVLPAVGTLTALRQARASAAAQPFVGFGDPLLEGRAGRERAPEGGPEAGTGIDINGIRALPSLPETARELRDIARNLNATAGDLYLREEATERQVKAMNLRDKKVIAFATHGAVSGELGSGEPGLVLTPPSFPDKLDDGFLGASEVSRLDLDADWVVLSACSTAAGDIPNATALSGLAKAFLYAGARSVLVSHWAVDSEAAAALTTATFALWNEQKHRPRAEALRLAQRSLLSTKKEPKWSHPAYWAPFILVGDGAATIGR